MSVPLLDLKRENQPLLEEIKKKIEPVLQSSSFILGQTVQEFENNLQNYLEATQSKILGVSSGTDALLLSLMSMELPQGSEVLTTPFTFFATTGTIHRAGLKPVFVDIEEDTFNIDSVLVEEFANSSKSEKVKALLPVHLYGQAAEMDSLLKIAKEKSWLLLEDTAQSIGAKYKEKALGTLGDFGAYSFFPTKNLGAFGDGGLVSVNNSNYVDKATRMRVHGAKDRYQNIEVGGNFRLDSLQAAILSVKLSHLNDWHNMRRKNAETYNKLFAEKALEEFLIPPIEKEKNFHIYNQYVIRVKNDKRDTLKEYLDKAQIGSMVYYPVPMHLLQSFRYLGYQKGDFPKAEKASQEVLALPVHSYIRSDEIEQVVAAIEKFFKQ